MVTTDQNSNEAVQGACLCGVVKVSANLQLDRVSACHCSMCRNWTGGPWMVLDCKAEVGFEGEEHIARYASSDWAERGFCTRCGTHLFYYLIPADHYSLSAGLFDAVERMRFGEQIFIDEKPAFYDFANDTEKLTGAEVIAKFSAGG